MLALSCAFARRRGVAGRVRAALASPAVAGFAAILAAAAAGLPASRADDGSAPPAPAVTVLRPGSPAAPDKGSAPAAGAVTVFRPSPGNTLVLQAGRDGTVFVDAAVNGTSVRMAFDTGASAVSLTEADAARIGLSHLAYTMPFTTANGRSLGAPVMLHEVRIGKFSLDNVKAVVMPNLDVSLLGQSFLTRLQSYQMKDGVLTLNW
jgi:clan AA aspartic protease (TIGR02281 family)